MSEEQMTVIADGVGSGMAAGTGSEWAPMMFFTVPTGEARSVLSVILPNTQPVILRRMAAVFESLAEAIELALDQDQASEFLRPALEAMGETTSYDAVIDGRSGQDPIAQVLETARTADAPQPAPVTTCTVCGVRIFGVVAERGACLSCAPFVPEGEVSL